MLRLIRVRRSASRVLAVAAAMTATLMVPVAVSAAATPDAGPAASSGTAKAGAHSANAAQIFGLPVVTAAWAVVGLIALICGLAFASRSGRSFQAEPQLAMASGAAGNAPAASPTLASASDRPAARFGQSVAQSAQAAQHSLSNTLRLPDPRSETQAAI